MLFLATLSHNLSNRVLAKFGSGALAPPLDEAKAIVSDEFCKMSNISFV